MEWPIWTRRVSTIRLELAKLRPVLRAGVARCLEGRPLRTRTVAVSLREFATRARPRMEHEMSGLSPIALGVNVDHVATVRNARRARHPDPVHAALLAEQAGADSITMHLREDRRHIIDRDPFTLHHADAHAAESGDGGHAGDAGASRSDCALRTAAWCRRSATEVTTEGGLDVAAQQPQLQDAVAELAAAGIRVSLFIDPDAAQMRAARAMGAPVIELHTGRLRG